jgi:hypothetical protein
MIAVHGPHTWGDPFFAQTADIYVNRLGPNDFEFKAVHRVGLASAEPYTWDFGDGSPQHIDGYEVRHIYAAPGQKTVTVQIDTIEGVITRSITFTIPDGTEREEEEEQREAA